MSLLEPADPRLAEAHALLWGVREDCADEEMRKQITRAMRRTVAARDRLALIAREARAVKT